MKQVSTISKTISAVFSVLFTIAVYSAAGAQLQDAKAEAKYNFEGAVRGPSLGDITGTMFYSMSDTKGLWLAFNYNSKFAPKALEPDAPPTTPSRFGLASVKMPNGPVQPLTFFNEKYGDYLHGHPSELITYDTVPADGSRPPIKSRETQYGPPISAVSPDGNWFLFWQSDKEKWVAANLNGLKVITWPGKDVRSHTFVENRIVWMPDSRRWLEMDMKWSEQERTNQATRVWIHSLDHPDKSQEIVLEKPVRDVPLGFTKEGNLIMFEPYMDFLNDNQISFFIIHFDGTDENFKPKPVPSDKASVLNFGMKEPIEDSMVTLTHFTTMSTTGDHVVLLTGSYPESSGRKPLKMFRSYDLWLTDPYQRSMTKIGHMQRKIPTYKTLEEAKAHPMEPSQGEPTKLKWLPDNKRISYFLDGTLYTLTVIK